MPESFDDLYTRWLGPGTGRDPRVTPELVKWYRQAWERNEEYDRDAILRFILLERFEAGADLVLEALSTTDPQLAGGAAATAVCLIHWGYDLGPIVAVRDALERFRRRFPKWEPLATSALDSLNARE